MKKTCNQCQEKLSKQTADVDQYVIVLDYVCVNPKCPNYALVQIPAEYMPGPEFGAKTFAKAFKKLKKTVKK